MPNICAMPDGIWSIQVAPPLVVATSCPEVLDEFEKPPTA
jgi:hypothetical protein